MFGRHGARLRQNTLAAAAALSLTGALVATVSGTATAAPAASAPAVAAASTVTTIPTTCAGLTHRIVDGHLYRYVYRGQRFTALDFGTLNFGGTVETPQAFALAQETDTSDVYFAIRTNGSLWKVTYDGSLSTTQVAASGWAGIRHITASPTGTRLYALTANGLYRYSISSTGALRSLGAIRTSGWGGIGFISSSAPDSTFDTFIGVNKTSGALAQYLVNRSTGAISGKVLKASGWAGMKHVSVGSCTGAQANSASMVGFTTGGQAFGYFDPNAYDLNGADIRGTGQMGSGFSGLLVD